MHDLLFLDVERGRRARLGIDREAIQAARLFAGVLGRDELPVGIQRILDQHGLCLAAGVLHGVLLLAGQLALGQQRAFADLHADKLLGMAFALRRNFGVQVQGVAHQPLGARLQVFDLGVAGVGAVVEHGDRALHQVQLGGVLKLESVQRMLGMNGGVVDRDLRPIDAVVDDRQHGRLLALQLDRRGDGVLEELADVAGLGEGLDSFGQINSGRDSAFGQDIAAGNAGPIAHVSDGSASAGS